MSRRLSVAVLFAVVSAFMPHPAARAQGDPDHARLTAMAGTWDVDLTLLVQPTAPPIVTKGTSTIRSILNGLFIEETIEGTLNGRPFTTMAWTGYNADTKQYEATRIATTNTARIAEAGRFDPAANRFELIAEFPLAGETWRQRTVIEVLSPDAMVATSYLSFGTVPEWKGVVIRYTRRHAVDSP